MCWPCLYKEYSITIWAASAEGTANCLHRLAICLSPYNALCKGPSGQEDLSRTLASDRMLLGSVRNRWAELGKIELAVIRNSGSPMHSALSQCLCSSHLHQSYQGTCVSSVQRQFSLQGACSGNFLYELT